jgi:hypothetical protein
MTSSDRSHLIAKIVDALASLEDLQLLLRLMDEPERWWDARTIARETGTSGSSTGRGLDRLAARNLLDIRVTDEVRFRYRPGSPELESAGSALAEAYRQNPLAIVKLVTVARPRSTTDFANAFRIRTDDDR